MRYAPLALPAAAILLRTRSSTSCRRAVMAEGEASGCVTCVSEGVGRSQLDRLQDSLVGPQAAGKAWRASSPVA